MLPSRDSGCKGSVFRQVACKRRGVVSRDLRFFNIKGKQCPRKPGSVLRRESGASVIYLRRKSPCGSSVPPSIVALASDGTPSDDGIRELAASSGYGPFVAKRPVVSYTAFSPLPDREGRAVVFFYPCLPSPTASIFGSGSPCAARTFLSCTRHQRQRRGTASASKVSFLPLKSGYKRC